MVVMYTVTSVMFQQPDMRDFRKLEDAYEYASWIVGDGFEPLITKNGVPITWEHLNALVRGWEV